MEIKSPELPRSVNSGSDTIILVATADNRFVMPLATMIGSALANINPNTRVHLLVIDGGISTHNKHRLLKSWSDFSIRVNWVKPRLEELEGLQVSGHVNLLTYYRIVIPLILPENILTTGTKIKSTTPAEGYSLYQQG